MQDRNGVNLEIGDYVEDKLFGLLLQVVGYMEGTKQIDCRKSDDTSIFGFGSYNLVRMTEEEYFRRMMEK